VFAPRPHRDRTLAAAGAGLDLLARLDSIGTAALGPVAAAASDPATAGMEIAVPIGQNETFHDAMRGLGVPYEQFRTLVETCRPYRNLSRVRRGEVFRVVQAPDRALRRISFDLDEESYLSFAWDGAAFSVEEKSHPVERRLVGVSGTVNASLYASLQQAAAPLILAVKMDDVLGWDIDFNRDVQSGDTYRILYEEVLREGRLVRVGAIHALEFVSRGKAHRAFRHETRPGEPGWFDPQGGSLMKAMLRTPVEYSRVSSHFSLSRMHPIHKKRMPHYGIDYAAPLGTPVHAAAAGVVTVAGVQNGAGRYVTLRHDYKNLETSYLHLSRFGSGIRAGVRVKQGQVIGYVGASGWATGPHLDYRVKQNGQWIDPRRLRVEAAPPIAADQRDAYRTTVALYGQALDDLPVDGTGSSTQAVTLLFPPRWAQPAGVTVLCPPPEGAPPAASAPTTRPAARS